MSAYSEILQKYIAEKNIKISKLVQYCGMERSSMYKIINGKRKPANWEMVKRIANYIQLTPKECETYYDAYYRSRLSEEEYQQKQQIEEFIYNFDYIYNKKPIYLEHGGMEITTFDETKIHVLEGKTEINYYLKLILERTAQKKKSEIFMIEQFDNLYLRDTLLMIGKHNVNLQIQHILCFQNKGKYAMKNIEILKKVIPFYGCECQYEPYYYYDEITSHFYNMNLFCNVVICDEGVVTYTSDYMYGQLMRDKNVIQMYQKLFEYYQSQTYPLLTKVSSVLQEYMSVGQDVMMGTEQARAHSLHAEPCVIPFINERILRKNIKKTVLGREEDIELFLRYIEVEREVIDNGNFCCSFTLQGIEKFILTGKIEEIPGDFYYAIEQKDCIEIIKQMLPYLRKGIYRILKNKRAQINNELHVFASPSTGHLLFTQNKKELIYVYMNEPGMIQQFYDFMDGLTEEISLYSPEEAVEKVENIIRKYELKFNNF